MRRGIRRWSCLGLGLGLLSGAAVAQDLLWQLDGVAGDGIGNGLVSVGDVDGDGVPDVAVGLPGLDRVRIRSGVDGGPLVFMGGQAGSEFGDRVAALGDIDLDGVPDVGVCAPDTWGVGQFSVRSGADGTQLFSAFGQANEVGLAAAGLGDLDVDGTPDFAYTDAIYVGLHDDPGAVRVVSGATGATLVEITEVGGSPNFATLMDGGRDVDGDGGPDLVLHDSDSHWIVAYNGTALAAGMLNVYKRWSTASFSAVTGLAITDDVDGDGTADLAAAVQGQLRFLSADQPTTLMQAVGPTVGDDGKLPFFFDGQVVALGDVDGDGVGDVFAQHGFKLEGASAVSGADGRILFSSDDPELVGRLAAAGDLDGDGLPDVFVGTAHSAGTSLAGHVRALSSRHGAIESYGFGVHPSIHHASPELVVQGGALPGGELVLNGWSDDAESGWLLFGPPSGAIVTPSGAFVYVAPLVTMAPVDLPGISASGHTGQWVLPVPSSAGGLQFAMQLVLPTASGLSTTEGVRVEILP